MDKVRYQPEEIDRMISDEISRIDDANSLTDANLERKNVGRESFFARIIRFLRELKAHVFRVPR